jgi:molybdate transport system ATP-binding protein
MLDVRLRLQLAGFGLDVAFTGPESGITALFGPSGAGKSMVVNAMAGIVDVDAGHVRLGATTVIDTATGTLVPPRRRRFGYVFQDARLFPHMTVKDNLLYGWRRSPPAERRIDVDHVVALLGLAPLLERRPRGLSGGEAQRVGLGRALLAQPRLLLMDEPLAALDVRLKAEILPYIERLRDAFGLPIVYVSHSIEEVTRLADTLIVLDRGRVVAAGDVFEVMARLELLPPGSPYEAGAIVDCRVAVHDEIYALTRLHFDGGTLVVPRLPLAAGARLRVRILARDVLVALVRPEGLSAQNFVEGRVAGVRYEDGAYAEVQIAAGAARILARITRQSSERLGLVPGRPVIAVIKSMAIDRRGLA